MRLTPRLSRKRAHRSSTGTSNTLSMKRSSQNVNTVYVVALCNQRLRYHVTVAQW